MDAHESTQYDVFYSFRKTPRLGIAGSNKISSFSFWEIFSLISIVVALVYIPTNAQKITFLFLKCSAIWSLETRDCEHVYLKPFGFLCVAEFNEFWLFPGSALPPERGEFSFFSSFLNKCSGPSYVHTARSIHIARSKLKDAALLSHPILALQGMLTTAAHLLFLPLPFPLASNPPGLAGTPPSIWFIPLSHLLSLLLFFSDLRCHCQVVNFPPTLPRLRSPLLISHILIVLYDICMLKTLE